MNELLTPEPTEPSAEEGSTLNSQLLRLRGAADSMHTALLVWENHIDHPGARTAIHSAARVLLDAAAAMPTHYDDELAAHDAEVRAQALREAADKIHVSLQQAHKRAGRPLDPMFSQHDQGLWNGYKNAENWLRARAEQIIAHLEAQQTEASLRRGLADITAGRTVDLGSFAQPEPDQLGGEGSTSAYMPTTDEVEHRYAYDELYSMDCEADHHAFRRWLAAHDAEVRAQARREAIASLREKFGPTNRAADYLARAEQTKEDR